MKPTLAAPAVSTGGRRTNASTVAWRPPAGPYRRGPTGEDDVAEQPCRGMRAGTDLRSWCGAGCPREDVATGAGEPAARAPVRERVRYAEVPVGTGAVGTVCIRRVGGRRHTSAAGAAVHAGLTSSAFPTRSSPTSSSGRVSTARKPRGGGDLATTQVTVRRCQASAPRWSPGGAPSVRAWCAGNARCARSRTPAVGSARRARVRSPQDLRTWRDCWS